MLVFHNQPSPQLPEVINSSQQTLLRAEKNIDELLDTMSSNVHLLRQSNIDEELFYLMTGFEILE